MTEEETQEAQPTAMLAAIKRVRDNATWLLGAYAAVGAAILAKVAISVGDLAKPFPDDWHVYAAIGGYALAILGVGLAIWSLVPVLNPISVTLSDIGAPSEEAKDVKVIDKSFGPLLIDNGIGAGSSQDRSETFRSSLDAARAVRDTKWQELQNATQDAEREEKRRQYEEAESEVERLLDIWTVIRQDGQHRIISRRFRKAKRRMTLGALMVAVGAPLALWGIAKPPEKDETAKQVAALATPEVGTLQIAATVSDLYRTKKLLGENCGTPLPKPRPPKPSGRKKAAPPPQPRWFGGIASVLLERGEETIDVITLQQGQCKAVRLILPKGFAKFEQSAGTATG